MNSLLLACCVKTYMYILYPLFVQNVSSFNISVRELARREACLVAVIKQVTPVRLQRVYNASTSLYPCCGLLGPFISFGVN